MKIKELIEDLSTFDPEMDVVLRGYEGGYYDAESANNIITLVTNVNKEWYYGPHEDAADAIYIDVPEDRKKISLLIV